MRADVTSMTSELERTVDRRHFARGCRALLVLMCYVATTLRTLGFLMTFNIAVRNTTIGCRRWQVPSCILAFVIFVF